MTKSQKPAPEQAPPESEQDDDPTCWRCLERPCCCAYLPRDWRRNYAHPSYLTYALRRAAQDREAQP
jgi:hypothetical protein